MTRTSTMTKSFFHWMWDKHVGTRVDNNTSSQQLTDEPLVRPVFPLGTKTKDQLRGEIADEQARFYERRTECTKLYRDHIEKAAQDIDNIVLEELPRWTYAMGIARPMSFTCRLPADRVHGYYDGTKWFEATHVRTRNDDSCSKRFVRDNGSVYDQLFITSMKRYISAVRQYDGRLPIVHWNSSQCEYSVRMTATAE